MTDKAPSPETVRLIARILGARRTMQEEVPGLIDSVHRALSTLHGPAEAAAAGPRAAVRARPEAAVPSAPRPPRARAVFAPATAPTPTAAAPTLMRRAEIAPVASVPEQATATTRTGLRGVVKWYDPKTRNGSLRLPGHDDIAVDAATLDRATVRRLFKGQEIEASVAVEPDGAVRLLRISLPGEPESESLGRIGQSRRQQKPVVIEMKRDALRRIGARLEAEQILGGTRR